METTKSKKEIIELKIAKIKEKIELLKLEGKNTLNYEQALNYAREDIRLGLTYLGEDKLDMLLDKLNLE